MKLPPEIWTLRPAEPDDADAISDVMLEAGAKAWAYLGEELIRTVNQGVHHPADVVAVDERGEVFAFVSWDTDTGEIVRLFTHPRGWGYGAGQALLEAACTALRSAGFSSVSRRQCSLVRSHSRTGCRPSRARGWTEARWSLA